MATTDDVIEEQYRQLLADLERQVERTARFLERAMREGRISRDVETARRVGDELAALMERNFGRLNARFEAASEAVARSTLGEIGDLGIPESFTAQSVASMRAQVDGTLENITRTVTERAGELRTLIVDVVRSQVPPTEALATLRGVIEGTRAAVGTLLDTGLAAFDRSVSTQVADEAGVEWFLYDGPVDQITRDYCAERVGKRFTLAQLDASENDTGPNPPSIYCGGWNCRHRLVPLVDPEEIALYPVGVA